MLGYKLPFCFSAAIWKMSILALYFEEKNKVIETDWNQDQVQHM